MEENFEKAKLCPSKKKLNACTKDQLMQLAKGWEIPLKPNDTKEIMIDEIQDALLERGTHMEETNKKHYQVLADMERLKQELEQVKRKPAGEKVFEVTSAIKMVPIFREEDPEEFFRQFERVAVQLNCPEVHWPVLVQAVLVGKARRAYNGILLPLGISTSAALLK